MLQNKENTANLNKNSVITNGSKIPITELILTITHTGGDIVISRMIEGHNLPQTRIDEIRSEMKESASIILKERTCHKDLINTATLPDRNTKMLKLLQG